MINHRKLILLLICIQLGGYVFAQEAGKKIHFGFSVTPWLTSPIMDADALTESSTSLSLSAGGDIYFDLTNRLQLQSGISLQNMNIAYTDYSPQLPGDVVDGEYLPMQSYWDANYSLLFAGIPVKIKFNFGQPDKTNRLFLIGGADFDYRISSAGNIDLISKEQLVGEYSPEDFPFEVDQFWVSLSAGVGYEFKVGTGKCLISPVFNYTLTKLYPEEYPGTANGNANAFGIRLAYY